MTGANRQPRGRFVVTGSILVDLVLTVAALPQPGADLLTRASRFTVGGGFNVLVAAQRHHMRTAYAGRIGSGPFGQMVTAALAEVSAEILLEPVSAGDTGFCVVMVDDSAERTMLTSMGVDAELTSAELGTLRIDPDDTIHVSGYDLAYPHGPVLAEWLMTAGAGKLVIFDPGPLAGVIPQGLLDAVLTCSTWVSLNAAEAQQITGSDDRARAAAAILATSPGSRGVVIRDGANGCLLTERGHEPEQIPAFATTAVDTTGAGDCHVGVFAASLTRGTNPHDACVIANAAASIAVARVGPATAPTLAETQALVR